MDEESRAFWNLVASPQVMSDIETDDENHNLKTFRRPKWRTEQFNDMIQRIDAGLGIVRNYSETPASRVVNLSKVHPEIIRPDNNDDVDSDAEEDSIDDHEE